MSLTPPKRLFHIPSMSTVMYVDNADDVKEKGYVCVSHVWGFQQMYSADELGILSGVDWKIPLSNRNKIRRLIDAMDHFKKEYCWWDIFCMPQDKQNEINLEIPLMGDYYSGANMTLVLSDYEYNIPDQYRTWSSIISDVIQSGTGFTRQQFEWISKNPNLLDFSKDSWFRRSWTLQETVLSKKLVLIDVNGSHLNLSDLLDKIWYLEKDISCATNAFGYCPFLVDVTLTLHNYKNKSLELAGVLGVNARRECYKIHDKFYATLGILEYKDFVVDYDIDIDDLNKHIIRHAYSKGDITWMSVGGDIGTPFIQPMYKPFPLVQGHWKQDNLSVTFGDTLCVQAEIFGTVVCREKYTGSPADIQEIMSWTTRIFTNWGFDPAQILDCMMQYADVSSEITNVGMRLVKMWSRGVKIEDMPYETQFFSTLDLLELLYMVAKCFMGALLRGVKWENVPYETTQSLPMPRILKRFRAVTNKLLSLPMIYKMVTIVKVVTRNHSYPLIVCGNADEGDIVVIAKVYDSSNSKRGLGIVVSKSSKRKGVCVTPKNITKDFVDAYEFVV